MQRKNYINLGDIVAFIEYLECRFFASFNSEI